tara:strand:+ start:2345 stop:2467 length:123 start_codon:yes stop_codon:yes gene_type:complete
MFLEGVKPIVDLNNSIDYNINSNNLIKFKYQIKKSIYSLK